MWLTYTTLVVDAFSVWNAVGWLLLIGMLYGVWRLWRGMGMDAFERGLRELREGRRTQLAFPRRRPPVRRGGWLQVSLLPLMLISCGAAMLLAQAQRPDDVSRPLTWLLFIAAGTWYGTSAWSHWRGVGPFRNFALAGVASGVGVSAVLWGFYLAVDNWWGEPTYARVMASLPSLLWWTAVGGVVGGLMGACRASRVYGAARGDGGAAAVLQAETRVDEVAVTGAPRARKLPWGTIVAASAASLLFHLSAAPHLYRKIDVRYWFDWHRQHVSGDALTLTMTPVARTAPAQTFAFDFSTRDDGRGFVTQTDKALVDLTPVDNWQGYVTLANNSSAQPSMVAIPVRPIIAGTRITAEMVEVTESRDPAAAWQSNPQMIIGKVAQRTLKPGEPITMSQVVDPGVADPLWMGNTTSLNSRLVETLISEAVETAVASEPPSAPVNLNRLTEIRGAIADPALEGDIPAGSEEKVEALVGVGQRDPRLPLLVSGIVISPPPPPSAPDERPPNAGGGIDDLVQDLPETSPPIDTSVEQPSAPAGNEAASPDADTVNSTHVRRPEGGLPPDSSAPFVPRYAIGDPIVVFTKQSKSYTGDLVSWTEESILIAIGDDRVDISQKTVKRVVRLRGQTPTVVFDREQRVSTGSSAATDPGERLPMQPAEGVADQSMIVPDAAAETDSARPAVGNGLNPPGRLPPAGKQIDTF